ncbi:MAG TPA: glycoside hydrolase family 3 N-terminal domain-containing protein [Candidatus Dormibacteraeota bacterium]|nr:glycoside hydrolase family 3 N-terminal domain-containing protein [Candidatus Dormibacteraeota bacterium]
MPKRLVLALLAALIVSCGGPAPIATATPTPSPANSASPSPSPVASPSPTDQLGPGGLTLSEEIGAVIMVGFRGSLTNAVLADWKQRQFGGLLVVNLNHNATTAASMKSLIAKIRAADLHRLIAATDQEGGQVCIAISTVPCDAMPVGKSNTTQMAAAIKSLGFDLDLGPVSDICSGPSSIMWGRCYGTSPAPVATAVGAVVDGIHAAHMLSASKHFPGHGDTSVSSETQLPRINESLATLQSRDWPPFKAAIAHGTDFVLLGHLYYPAIDTVHSADLSPVTIRMLRSDLGFKGAIISDDMEMGAITNSTPAPEAAVEFLVNGGDMVMIAHDISVADATYNAIRAAVASGRLPRSRLDQAVAALQALPNR